MNSLAASLPVFVERRSGPIVVVFVCAAVLCVLLTDFRIGHSYEDWIDKNSIPYRQYHDMVETFGDADTLLATVDTGALNKSTIGSYNALVAGLREMDGVIAVFDPAEMFLGTSSGEPPDESMVESLQSIFQTSRADYHNVLISRDLKTMGLLVLLAQDKPEAHKRILATVRSALSNMGIRARLGGTAYFSETLKENIAGDMKRVITILTITAIIIMFIFFRDPVVVLCTFTGIATSVIYALAWNSAFGMSMNLLTLLLMPLVFCVGLTTAVHLFTRTDRMSWSFAYAGPRVAVPAAIAALTTAVGCLSFLFAPQPIISRMGFVLSGAVIFTFVSMMIFVPALVNLTPRVRGRKQKHPRVGSGTAGRRNVVSGIVVAVAAMAAAGLPGTRINPDAIFFFDDDAELIRAYRYIEDHLTGLLVSDIVIRARDGKNLRKEPHATQVKTFLQLVGEIPEVTAVVTGYDFPESTAAGADLDSALGVRLFSEDGMATRVVVRIRNLADRSYASIARDIQKIWLDGDSSGLDLHLTGLIPLILKAQDQLLRIQARMLVLVMLAITAILFAVFRSPGFLGLAMVANFTPLLITAGCMGWFNIAIDSITVFVGSVMLGIVVDDTIHLLHACHVHKSMDAALAEVGPALWITSVMVGLSFATLAGGDLAPIRQFGMLSVIAVISAYLCDVYLLPTLWKMRTSS